MLLRCTKSKYSIQNNFSCITVIQYICLFKSLLGNVSALIQLNEVTSSITESPLFLLQPSYLLPPLCLPPLCPLDSTFKTNCHAACKTHPESSLSHHFHQCLLSLSKRFSSENDFCLPKDIWWWLDTFLLPSLWACYWHQCVELSNATKHPTMHRITLYNTELSPFNCP